MVMLHNMGTANSSITKGVKRVLILHVWRWSDTVLNTFTFLLDARQIPVTSTQNSPAN